MHSQMSTHTEHDYARLIAVLGYLTIVGWLVAMLCYGSYKSKLAGFHLRQSLGLIILAALLSFIPLIGWALNIVVAAFWLVSVYHAFKADYYTVPWLGVTFQTHLRFIV
ncbi:hypothetical protein HII17_08330 [Thalassotalea sp. M1531]|uniref:DUF4870 domain-containing protein n=2 Tax=Thalassotalea algicola TaxID=2716224 RepID=A0A7Y0Q6W0_9GAMM|nr:hypothetical protein [Thalassotalea algicola]